LLDEEKGSQVARRLFTPGMVGEFYAMLHNTAVPTRLKAGYKTNVIPSEAQVTLDGRFLPGFDQESYLAELRAALPEEVALEVEEYAPALESPYDSPLYRLAKEKLEALHPGATAVPFLQVGATDAKYLEPLGVQVYGFAPVRFEPDEPSWGLVHAHDERIPVAGFGFGLRALYETVHDFARG
jgi:acetylornithine deacetylase/succinyl-diaminopimelate desuccinylase-like protein